MKKGMSTLAILVIGVMVMVMGLVAIGTWAATVSPAAPEVEYEGEFDELHSLQEVSGNDLAITQQGIPENGTVWDANVVMSYDINDTDGDSHTLAIPFEVSGDNGFESVTVEGKVENTSAFELRDAYLVPDTEDQTLSSSSSGAIALNVEDSEEIDEEVGVLPSGDWVAVLKIKSIETFDKATDLDIAQLSLEGTTSASDAAEDLLLNGDSSSAKIDNVQ